MIAPVNCNPYCDCAQRLVRCERAAQVEARHLTPHEQELMHRALRVSSEPVKAPYRPTAAQVKERLDQLPERRKIFTYEHGLAVFAIVRESDGSVSVTVSNVGADPVTVGVPAAQWRKLIGKFATERDLWPGAEYSRPWYEDTEVGKPSGGTLA